MGQKYISRESSLAGGVRPNHTGGATIDNVITPLPSLPKRMARRRQHTHTRLNARTPAIRRGDQCGTSESSGVGGDVRGALTRTLNFS